LACHTPFGPDGGVGAIQTSLRSGFCSFSPGPRRFEISRKRDDDASMTE